MTPGERTGHCLIKTLYLYLVGRFSIREMRSGDQVRTVFTISPVLEQDSGRIVCESANRFGRDQKVFSLSVEDVPSPPADVHLAHLSSRAAEISWRPAHNGNSPILNYIIEYVSLPGEKKKARTGLVLHC